MRVVTEHDEIEGRGYYYQVIIHDKKYKVKGALRNTWYNIIDILKQYTDPPAKYLLLPVMGDIIEYIKSIKSLM